jgi:hypothetical protein
MIEGFEVIDGVSRYLRQEVSSRVFRDWMVGVQLRCEAERANHSISPKDAEKAGVTEQLLSAIDVLYAQFSDKHLSEQQMRVELAKLVLLEISQTPTLTVSYSFLKPLFGSPLKDSEWGASETSSEGPNARAQSRTVPAAA